MWQFEPLAHLYDAFANRIERQAWSAGSGGTMMMGAGVDRFAQDGWDPAKPSPVGTENFDTILDLSGGNWLNARRMFGDGFDEPIARESSGGTVGWYAADRQGSAQAVYREFWEEAAGSGVTWEGLRALCIELLLPGADLGVAEAELPGGLGVGEARLGDELHAWSLYSLVKVRRFRVLVLATGGLLDWSLHP